MLCDEEINGIEVDFGSCDDVEYWLFLVLVGFKNMVFIEVVKDFDKFLGFIDDSIVDFVFDYWEDDFFFLWNWCEDCWWMCWWYIGWYWLVLLEYY